MAVNTIAYFPPAAKFIGGDPDFSFESYPMSGTVNPGDIVALTSGVAASVATNAAALAGIAMHGSAEIYNTPNASVGVGTLFGFNEVGSGLFTAEPTNLHVLIPLAGETEVEFSLNQATTYAQSLVGTQVGILLSGGVYVADPTQGNKVATIVRLVEGPGQQTLGNTGGGRVIVKFLAAALQV